MIISHKYKFIFLKTAKTAGTSIEIALSGICGDQDIITPVSPRDEKIRQALGHRWAQNYQQKQTWLSWIRGRGTRFYNHIQASEVKRLIGDEIWDEYYKFCFERNPWDRLLSYYFHLHKDEPTQTIAEFLQTDKPEKLRTDGYGVYTIDGEVAVDRVCKYENLEQELASVGEHLGFPHPLELPHAKSGFRKDLRHYSEILSEDEQRIIRDKFSKEIKLWGY